MMWPKVSEFQREQELFRTELVNLVDQRHALVKLSVAIDWNAAAERFGALYAASVGRPGVPIRLRVGLLSVGVTLVCVCCRLTMSKGTRIR